MKIVIDARESGTSTGRYVDKLIEYLYKLQPKHQITILTRAERLSYMTKIAPTFTVAETSFKEFTFAEQLGLKHQLDGLKVDLVHFPMVQQPVWYRGKVVTTMQDLTTLRFKNPSKNPLIFWIKLQVYKWVNKRVARRSRAIITISKFVANDVAIYTHVQPAKITTTYLGADVLTDTPEPIDSLISKQFIMYIGRPTPHKNLGRLIDAFVELRQQHPELYLVLAGKTDANYQRYADRVVAENIPNVVFTDFISDGQLRWLYEHCAAYVFPSLSEGFGLPGLEAMAQGAPVVSSNATCLPEIYGEAAQYFDPLNVDDMASKIGAVLDDPGLRANLIKKGKQQANKYSWQRMAEQTLAVYDKVLSQKA